MHALSVKQPYAEALASGEKTREHRVWKASAIVGCDLLICASLAVFEGFEARDDEPRGVARCVVRVVKITGDPADYAWHVENARRVEAVPIKGGRGLFMVDDSRIRYLTARRASARAAERSKARARLKVKVGPYTFSLEDDRIRGERAKTPAQAFARAGALANARGRDVTILRDGLAIRIVEPE